VPVRTARILAAGPDFTARMVTCRDDHTGWSPAEVARGYGLVLIRSGRFRYAGRGGAALADAQVGYVSVPGDEQRFAHPAGGDVCTSIEVSAGLWQQLPFGPAAAGPVTVDARLDLAHRLLLRAAGTDVGYATAERLLDLLAGVRGGALAYRWPLATTRGDAVAVATAREAITAGHPDATGLVPLARRLGVSPYRLSRIFHRVMGIPLTRFRNRVRVSAALDRLEQGEPSLARLAADLGFADQAHLTRTVRAHVGHTPGQLRRLLGPPPARTAGRRPCGAGPDGSGRQE
jgi:AraC-like DNA-binding protein